MKIKKTSNVKRILSFVLSLMLIFTLFSFDGVKAQEVGEDKVNQELIEESVPIYNEEEVEISKETLEDPTTESEVENVEDNIEKNDDIIEEEKEDKVDLIEPRKEDKVLESTGKIEAGSSSQDIEEFDSIKTYEAFIKINDKKVDNREIKLLVYGDTLDSFKNSKGNLIKDFTINFIKDPKDEQAYTFTISNDLGIEKLNDSVKFELTLPKDKDLSNLYLLKLDSEEKEDPNFEYKINNEEKKIIFNSYDISGYFKLEDNKVEIRAVESRAARPNTLTTNLPKSATMNLFDYSIPGINSGKTLQFNTGNGRGINKWTGKNGGPLSNIVRKELQNEFPILEGWNGQSLAYLFDDSRQDGKKGYFNVQGLFSYDDSTGKYSYNSDDNYAWYDESENKLIVYKGTHDIGNREAIGFFPFNSYDSTYGVTRAQLDNLNVNVNHHLGLSLDVPFYLPENGKYNGKNIYFNFSGDDDIWVFVNGHLVLDLGGIHDRCEGRIDFTRGISSTEGNISNYLNPGCDNDMKVFYLERGGSVSNLKIEFLLPPPEGVNVSLDKTVTGNMIEKTDKNKKFTFKYTVKKDCPEGTCDNCNLGSSGKIQLSDNDGIKNIFVPNGYKLTITEIKDPDFELININPDKIGDRDINNRTFTWTNNSNENNTFTVEFVNSKDVVIPTGITSNNNPYALILFGAVVLGFIVLNSKKRSLEDL